MLEFALKFFDSLIPGPFAGYILVGLLGGGSLAMGLSIFATARAREDEQHEKDIRVFGWPFVIFGALSLAWLALQIIGVFVLGLIVLLIFGNGPA